MSGNYSVPSTCPRVDLGQYEIGAFVHEADISVDVGIELRRTVPRDALHADGAGAAAGFFYYLHPVVVNLEDPTII